VNVINVQKLISDKFFTSIIVTIGKGMDRLCLNAQCSLNYNNSAFLSFLLFFWW